MTAPSPPRRPTPTERLRGALDDLDRVSADGYVPGAEVGAIVAVMRQALRDMGVGYAG